MIIKRLNIIINIVKMYCEHMFVYKKSVLMNRKCVYNVVCKKIFG